MDPEQVICLLSRLDSYGLREALEKEGYTVNYARLIKYIDPLLVTKIPSPEVSPSNTTTD